MCVCVCVCVCVFRRSLSLSLSLAGWLAYLLVSQENSILFIIIIIMNDFVLTYIYGVNIIIFPPRPPFSSWLSLFFWFFWLVFFYLIF